MKLNWLKLKKTKKMVSDRFDIYDRARIVYIVSKYFNGDAQKTSLWFTTPNPNFGSVSPIDMIKSGRQKALLDFVEEADRLNDV